MLSAYSTDRKIVGTRDCTENGIQSFALTFPVRRDGWGSQIDWCFLVAVKSHSERTPEGAKSSALLMEEVKRERRCARSADRHVVSEVIEETAAARQPATGRGDWTASFF